MTTVSVRYITDDVDAAVAFYVERLGFNVEMQPGPGFAMLSRGDLRLLLNQPGAGGAGQPTPDGRKPEPGGWNRIQIEVRTSSARSRRCARPGRPSAARSSGRGGNQILLEDPSGNASSSSNPPTSDHLIVRTRRPATNRPRTQKARRSGLST